jgi:diaminopimelate epimerase
MYFSFSKYQGAGNDFILVDDRAGSFPAQQVKFIEKLCNRRFGIGADGLILLQSSNCARFRMRIFNADGREVSMCGNGIRCLVQYIRSLGFKEDEFLIETMHATIPCSIHGDKVRVLLGKPHVLHWGVQIEEGNEQHEAFVVNTGVPHAVIFVEELEFYPVEEIGRRIRHHPLFAPNGVNVNFAKMVADGTLRMRTYERGVESETLACGTGAAAVALAAAQKWQLSNPIRVISSAKEYLEVCIQDALSGGKEIEMLGGAMFVFEGRIGVEQIINA